MPWETQAIGRVRRAGTSITRIFCGHSRHGLGAWLDLWGRLLLVLGCGCLAIPRARAQSSREYDVKAALLLNFTRFVEWPPEAFANADAPVVIGILGTNRFGRVLDEIVRDELCGGRAIKVEQYRNVEAARNCHILFIAASEETDLPRILRVVRGRPILTVGDFEGFAQRGGMIRFMKDADDKIQLRINLTAVKTSGLTISAKLLRVAEVIAPPER